MGRSHRRIQNAAVWVARTVGSPSPLLLFFFWESGPLGGLFVVFNVACTDETNTQIPVHFYAASSSFPYAYACPCYMRVMLSKVRHMPCIVWHRYSVVFHVVLPSRSHTGLYVDDVRISFNEVFHCELEQALWAIFAVGM